MSLSPGPQPPFECLGPARRGTPGCRCGCGAAAARQLGLAVAAVEERTHQQLQRIDAKLQVSDGKVQAMQARVSRVAERAGDKKLDDWIGSLSALATMP